MHICSLLLIMKQVKLITSIFRTILWLLALKKHFVTFGQNFDSPPDPRSRSRSRSWSWSGPGLVLVLVLVLVPVPVLVLVQCDWTAN